ncbi:disease resistance protein RPM1-like [Oryza glaberrima]|nr:disease resistance protein RPM1-like [Oryza glaberrima]
MRRWRPTTAIATALDEGFGGPTVEKLVAELLCTIRPRTVRDENEGPCLNMPLSAVVRGVERQEHRQPLSKDDVWDQNVYFEIQGMFQNPQASRIIITTRMEHVAVLAPSECHLKIQALGEIDAFNLFCRRAFYNRKDHRCPLDLENVAASIVTKCKGLPLAIVTMGGLMSTKLPTEHAWQQMYNQLRSELAKNDDVKAILKLSYHALPADQKNCFLYCSLFPEDFRISRESLVRYWVAEGFAVRIEHNRPEDVAEINLMELIHRNMLEVDEYDELGKVNSCKMHDIVRNLALSIAGQERFGYANDYGAVEKIDWEVRRLSLFLNNGKSCASTVKFPHLRALLETTTHPPGLLSSILSESKYLTVLELQDSDITEVPACIGKLFNLRYIGLRRTRLCSLPESIDKLSNLQTLDIKQTKIEKLPRGITKIKKLRHLLADRYEDENKSEFRYFIGVQAPKELSNLEELRTLETVEASKDLAEQLKKLMQLRSVWIDNIRTADCTNLFATLSKMPLLSSLLLSASHENETLCLEALKPESEELHRLIVRGCWAARTLEYPIFRDHGKNLKYLVISWCRLQEDPLLLLAPYVPNLVFLSLNRVNSAITLVLSADCFPQLKTLVLKRMPDVNHLEIIGGALQHIEGLYVVSLPKLDNVPQGIESLRYLKKLWLLGLHKNFRSQWQKNGMHQKMQHVPELHVKD